MAEQAFDDDQAGWTDHLGLRQTPLWIEHEIGLCVRRQMIVHCGAVARLELARMNSDQLVPDRYGGHFFSVQ